MEPLSEETKRQRRLFRFWVIVALCVSLTPFLIVGFAVWNLVNLDNHYRESMYHSGHTKVVIHEFRRYYHERSSYDALTLEELRDRGILSEVSYSYITSRPYKFRAFTPQTPDNAAVLTLGPLWDRDILHKGDLTAHPDAADTIIR